jgi:ABC-type multidrug transport system ATPase subunit
MWRLTLSELSHSFGPKAVFGPIRFDADITRLGISGANGAGKSTLMRILAGLMDPASGTMSWTRDGMTIEPAAIRHDLGFAAPYLGIYPELSVRENLDFVASLRGLGSEAVLSAADRLGMTDFLHQTAGACSSGQQQRLRLATAIVHSPSLLFLDEPGTNLDAAGFDTVAALVREWRGAVVVASNQADELSWCMERLTVDGRP